MQQCSTVMCCTIYSHWLAGPAGRLLQVRDKAQTITRSQTNIIFRTEWTQSPVCFWQSHLALQLESATLKETFYLACQYDWAACKVEQPRTVSTPLHTQVMNDVIVYIPPRGTTRVCSCFSSLGFLQDSFKGLSIVCMAVVRSNTQWYLSITRTSQNMQKMNIPFQRLLACLYPSVTNKPSLLIVLTLPYYSMFICSCPMTFNKIFRRMLLPYLSLVAHTGIIVGRATHICQLASLLTCSFTITTNCSVTLQCLHTIFYLLQNKALKLMSNEWANQKS